LKKTYVLDTNVLLHDPDAISHFEDNDLAVPLDVIEEIDRFKRDLTELGRNARQVSRMLDGLRHSGNLAAGVKLSGGGTLRIVIPREAKARGQAYADDQILRVALEIGGKRGARVIVVSKDINLRIKADALGIPAEDYETDRVDVSELYTGHTELTVSPDLMEKFRQEGSVSFENTSLSPNQYALMHDAVSTRTALARFDGDARRLVALVPCGDDLRPVYPRNKEQSFAVDALLNPAIKVVTIIGKAGTGKTLLAVAAGVSQALDKKAFRRLLVSRPVIAMGKDIGYLPGDVNEKLNPWMQPLFDAFDFLASARPALKDIREIIARSETVSVEPLTYIRGRSIAQQFMVVDEAQNLTPLEVKTIITRVGHGTKIVFTGDIYQIDNPYVDSMSNGLSTVVEKLRPYALAAHIVLSKGVRSEVAELAANIL
jgi:PhoH-like ATPase